MLEDADRDRDSQAVKFTYAAPTPEEKGIVFSSAFQSVAYHILPRELWKRACNTVSYRTSSLIKETGLKLTSVRRHCRVSLSVRYIKHHAVDILESIDYLLEVTVNTQRDQVAMGMVDGVVRNVNKEREGTCEAGERKVRTLSASTSVTTEMTICQCHVSAHPGVALRYVGRT